MPTFGGLSFGFSGSTEIADFLKVIEPQFIRMVLSHSVLLSRFEDETNYILEVAQLQAYPRIGLYLASTKNTDNKFLFADSNEPDNLELIYQNTLNAMTDLSSPFSEGITAIAAGFTAIILMRNLPLNNSSIKVVDTAKDFEDRYGLELEQIVSLYSSSNQATSIKLGNEFNIEGNSFYIALDIDPQTLSADLFDVDPVDEPLIVKEVYPDLQPKTLERLTISDRNIAVGIVYHSSIENLIDNNLNTKEANIGCFEVKDGDRAMNIIDRLASKINELTLANSTNLSSNLIASPISGQYNLRNVNLLKKRLYPDQSSNYDSKIANFSLLSSLSYLNFDARRLSSIVNRELLIVYFVTFDKEIIAKRLAQTEENFVYRGLWELDTTYNVGDLVKSATNNYYYAVENNINNQPGTTIAWTYLNLLDSKKLFEFRDSGNNYIDGLIYGTIPRYNFLDKFSPKSLIIDVEKGSTRSISTEDVTLTPTEISEGCGDCCKFPPDSFYFRFSEGVNRVSGDLKLSLASVDLLKYPELVSSNLIDEFGNLVIKLENETSIDSIVSKILEAVYKVSQISGILGLIVKRNAIQFISFLKSRQTRHVVDIRQIPPGLEVATGNIYTTCTEYYNAPRSLLLTTISSTDKEVELIEEEVREQKWCYPSVSQVEYGSRSVALQNISNRLRRIGY